MFTQLYKYTQVKYIGFLGRSHLPHNRCCDFECHALGLVLKMRFMETDGSIEHWRVVWGRNEGYEFGGGDGET